MRIYHFGGNAQVSEIEQFNAILSLRYGENANDYWIGPDDSDYPCLNVLVKDEYAFAMYVPNENHPGFTSICAGTDLDPNGTTMLYNTTPTEEVEFYNDQIISIQLAVKAAIEFFTSGELPKAINWLEL